MTARLRNKDVGSDPLFTVNTADKPAILPLIATSLPAIGYNDSRFPERLNRHILSFVLDAPGGYGLIEKNDVRVAGYPLRPFDRIGLPLRVNVSRYRLAHRIKRNERSHGDNNDQTDEFHIASQIACLFLEEYDKSRSGSRESRRTQRMQGYTMLMDIDLSTGVIADQYPARREDPMFPIRKLLPILVVAFPVCDSCGRTL
ncbi:MAG: hypothetical protein MZV63_63310 [Marinilabiliales bacterium]|nr:hypothetical protein [Marinilabiliales bacterium]